jgi:uncharacterized RDD family membrane protein YckC
LEATGTVNRDTVCAGFVDRLVAFIIDAIILAIPAIIISVITDEQAIRQLLGLIIGVAYAVYFWTSTGQTPGKSVMKLKVVHADGGNLLTPGQAVVRYVGYIISGIAIFLGFLWIIWDPKHEGWHDKIATTKVIKVG